MGKFLALVIQAMVEMNRDVYAIPKTVTDCVCVTDITQLKLNLTSHLERWLRRGKKLKELNHIPESLKTINMGQCPT